MPAGCWLHLGGSDKGAHERHAPGSDGDNEATVRKTVSSVDQGGDMLRLSGRASR